VGTSGTTQQGLLVRDLDIHGIDKSNPATPGIVSAPPDLQFSDSIDGQREQPGDRGRQIVGGVVQGQSDFSET